MGLARLLFPTSLPRCLQGSILVAERKVREGTWEEKPTKGTLLWSQRSGSQLHLCHLLYDLRQGFLFHKVRIIFTSESYHKNCTQ